MEELGLQGLLLIVAGCVVIGLGLGFLIGHFLGGDKEEAAQKEAEAHEAYRDEVHEHFEQTSQIMSRMVEDYRELYKHMSDGAGNLANIHPEKVITPPPKPEAITEQADDSDRDAADDTSAPEETVPTTADDEVTAQTRQADMNDTTATVAVADSSEAPAETTASADTAVAADDNATAAPAAAEEDAADTSAPADGAQQDEAESEQARARRLSGDAPERGEKVGGI